MKQTACLILLLLLCAALAACGGKDIAETTAPETTSPAETEVEPMETSELLPPPATETQATVPVPPAPAKTEESAPAVSEPLASGPAESDVTVVETTAAVPDEPEVFDFTKSDLSEYIALGKYLGIEVALPAPKPVTDTDVDSAIAEAIAALPPAAMITDRACAAGDKVNVDYIGTADGEVIEQSREGGFTFVLGSRSTLDGFEDGVLGMTPGETRTVTLTFPTDYYAELAGKEAAFEITLNYIFPQLDDALCRTYFGVQSVQECRASVKADIENARAAGTAEEKEAATWTKALANSRIIAYPDNEVDAAFSAITAEYAALAENYGLTYETVFPTLYGISLEEAESVLMDSAKNQVAQRLLLYAIARDMNIDVSDEKFEAELAATAGIIGAESVDALVAQLGKDRTSLKEDKLYSEVIEIMIGKASFVTLQTS
ncbi:MAG: FKBP-type peptidyl-prolyl cis-trans isomerase [Clostridia bacterium]|nr:FKBP-type peptidyl-prolyl cis-trans isomerase [Clostridia bacterium]